MLTHFTSECYEKKWRFYKKTTKKTKSKSAFFIITRGSPCEHFLSSLSRLPANITHKGSVPLWACKKIVLCGNYNVDDGLQIFSSTCLNPLSHWTRRGLSPSDTSGRQGAFPPSHSPCNRSRHWHVPRLGSRSRRSYSGKRWPSLLSHRRSRCRGLIH